MKVVVKVLEKYEVFNFLLFDDGESLIIKKFINIGIVVEISGGFVVFVICDVNKKGIEEFFCEFIEMFKKVCEGKFKVVDMQGGIFIIFSLGGIGGMVFMFIVNVLEVVILGVFKFEMKFKWNGKEFELCLMVLLSLFYDY